MKSKTQKLLSLIMAMAMCLSLLQTTAFAATETHSYEVKSVTWDEKDPSKYTVNKECKDGDGAKETETGNAPSTTVPATCQAEGKTVYKVTIGGVDYTNEIVGKKLDHTKGAVVKENIKPATCETAGSYDDVVRCTVCKTILDTKPQTIPATGHDYKYSLKNLKNVTATVNEKGEVTSKLVDATKDGEYTLVKVCDNEPTAKPVETTITVNHLSALEGQTVKETVKDGNVTISGDKVWLNDCAKAGKYNEVTYAMDGKTVLATKEVTVPAGHTADKAVAEKASSNVTISYDKDGKIVATNNSCAAEGSYESVVYCANPNHTKKVELSREKVTVAKSTKHQKAAPKKENDTGTCQVKGTYDEVVYCAICGVELSRTQKENTAVKAHEAKNPVKENIVEASCDKSGSYESVVYCKYGEEMTRTIVSVPATGKHTWAYAIDWQYGKNFYAGSEAGWDLDENSLNKDGVISASVIKTCTDANCKQADIPVAATVKVTCTETVEAEHVCTLGTKTFKAVVEGTVIDPDTKKEVKVAEATQAFNWNKKGLVSHKKGAGVIENEDADKGTYDVVYRCPVCNTEYDRFQQKTQKEPVSGEPKPEEPEEKPEVKLIDIADAVISGSESYKGEYFNVGFTVTLNGKKLTENVDFVFTNARKNNFRNVGPHAVTIAGIGKYTGEAEGTLYITKVTKSQKISASVTSKTYKAADVKKAAKSFTVKVTGAKGTVSYTSSNTKYVTVKNGKITVKKGAKKGTYKVTIKAAAKSTSTTNYKASNTVTVKVVVK